MIYDVDLKWLEFLWHVAIKARANFKSELSRLPAEVSHHIVHKPNLWLRLNLDNGMALTNWEHQNIAHKNEPEFLKRISLLKGEHYVDKLITDYKWRSDIPNLDKIEVDCMTIIKEKKSLMTDWLEKRNYKTKEILMNYKKLYKII